jgi:hypothetical protein
MTEQRLTEKGLVDVVVAEIDPPSRLRTGTPASTKRVLAEERDIPLDPPTPS